MKRFSIFLIVVILLVVAGLLFVFWPKIATAANSITTGGTGSNGTGGTGSNGGGYLPAGSNTNTSLNLDVSLAKGSRGNEVKQLQTMLNAAKGYFSATKNLAPLVVDGIFGDKTEQMLRGTAGVSSITLRGAINRFTSYTG